MSNICKCIACEVEECKFNQECNCVRDEIKVGCNCNDENCSCCESFEQK